MKTLLVLAVIGGGAYGGYYLYQHRKPEKRACAKMADLCGEKEKNDAERCERDMSDLRKNASVETLARFDACVDNAKTCAEGVGCAAGAGLSTAGEVFNQFIKGLGGALPK
jgi:hypothetical protein